MKQPHKASDTALRARTLDASQLRDALAAEEFDISALTALALHLNAASKTPGALRDFYTMSLTDLSRYILAHLPDGATIEAGRGLVLSCGATSDGPEPAEGEEEEEEEEPGPETSPDGDDGDDEGDEDDGDDEGDEGDEDPSENLPPERAADGPTRPSKFDREGENPNLHPGTLDEVVLLLRRADRRAAFTLRKLHELQRIVSAPPRAVEQPVERGQEQRPTKEDSAAGVSTMRLRPVLPALSRDIDGNDAAIRRALLEMYEDVQAAVRSFNALWRARNAFRANKITRVHFRQIARALFRNTESGSDEEA